MKRRWLFVPFLIGILAIGVVAAAGTVSVVSSQAGFGPNGTGFGERVPQAAVEGTSL